ncbi:uncharacterized protein LOC110810555 [Carica papaya]|uniref:uncharacterized protein LOC110810555 n=1 Tax=Carica papaya TaxID=3649 RepID=UPI000B8C716E|nr:uncharacterized protein LOC110810555 [Carica papaya]
MVRSKAASKKQQKRGIDFKKIKRKLGRKLPPPKNATDTQIKSRAIILPEQSVAAEKTGLAVSKKGLTLKELLQQTSHHNAKVRKDALCGIRDLFQNHPAELRSHRYAVIETLRVRISDEDEIVRETLYQLLKSVVFPGCKEDNQGPLVSLMMTYIFTAMTHLAIDIRLMAFKCCDLLVQHYPASFSLYAEEETAGQETLHGFEPDVPKESAGFSHISKKLKDLVAVLVNCFKEFIPLVHAMPVMDALSFDCMYSILQSIDLAVRFLVYGNHKNKLEAKLHPEIPDVTAWDQTISSVLVKKLLGVFPLYSVHHFSEKDDDRYFILNVVITQIFLQFSEWICPPADLLEKFLEFIENAFLGKIGSSTRSGKAVWEKNILSLLPFIPKLVSLVDNDWKYRLMQAFTMTFSNCNPESSLKLACVSVIEKMLIPEENMLHLDASDPEVLDYQITWIRGLPPLLILLGDKHPSSSLVVLHLLLHIGQYGLLSASPALESEIQFTLGDFYSTFQEEGTACYGPFVRLSRDAQELSLCCLYYFSNIDSFLLKSIASCCLCPELEPLVLFRIMEVLHSAYKGGRIQIADHISFLITLVSCFKVSAGKIYSESETETKISNHEEFKELVGFVCSYLSQMGDSSLVFHMLKRVILDQIMLKLPLDNTCALLRTLTILDSKPTRLSEQDILALSNILLGYLIDVVLSVPEDDDATSTSSHMDRWCYYLIPCFFLFDRSHNPFESHFEHDGVRNG